LLIIVIENPAAIEAIAAFSVKGGQNSARITIGQKVAAMPDQPKIANQKIVLSGATSETTVARAIAPMAIANVE
jgi:hypothetical protein